MASRDKKSTVGRKQGTTATPHVVLAQAGEESPTVVGLVEKRKPGRKPGVKRTISLKAKSKAKPSLLATKGAKRTACSSGSSQTVQKIRNGAVAPPAVIRKRPLSLRERIIPPTPRDATVSVNDRQKRRIKQEPLDADVESAKLPAASKAGNRRMKKTVKECGTDATLLDIEIKKEPLDEDAERTPGSTPTPMEGVEVPKVAVRKGRPPKHPKPVDKALLDSEILKKKVKKENVDVEAIILHKIDVSDNNVIDFLNLDVDKVFKKTDVHRRHSIEKFPVTPNDVCVHDDSALILPKVGTKVVAKRQGRPRPNSESKAKSALLSGGGADATTRMLRNGKTRRLQKFPLFDGLDSEYKMRRRLASDFSGSEIAKLSGYESDSSLSSSLHENADEKEKEQQDATAKKDASEADKEKALQLLETLENNQPDTEEGKQIVENVSAAIKRSLSMEAAPPVTAATPLESERDTNSNLTVKSEPTTPVKTDFVSDVPKLLGIMKQAFNEKGVSITEEMPKVEPRKTRSSMRKTKSPEKDAPQLPATTISTLTAVGIALGPDITVTAEEVQKESKTMLLGVRRELEAVEQDTVEDAEAELLDILTRQQEQKGKSPQSTPSTSVNGGSPINEHKGSSPAVDDTPESLAEKSQILKALGLQTLQEAEEARKKQVPKADNYTGTLKTVIKLNRCAEKKKSARNPIKMTLQKKGRSSGNKDSTDKVDEDEYKIMNEGTSWKHHGGQSSDTAGAQRKSHYSNRSNMDGSSEHTSDGDTNQNEEGGAAPGKLLVIPEKASSFSIHPGRLCKDECSYCFGKFGLFDTPCHIAQIKAVDRQDKILANEKHLTRDSCLCDACYRHVDRKVNMQAYMSKTVKRNALVAPAPRQNHCHVLGCNEVAANILKRKWLIKMRRMVCQIINIDLDNPGLHSIPTCKEHYAAVEHLMVCAMCKRRLARNHIYYLGAESNELQNALNAMCIPVKLNEKPVVCKLCRYFATLVLKSGDDFAGDTHTFFTDYKRRLLHFHNVELMEDYEATEPILAPIKNQDTSGRKRKRRHHDPPVLEPQIDIHSDEPNDAVPSSDSRPDSPSDYTVDYRNLIPSIAIECLNDVEITKKPSQSSTLSIRRISKAEAQEKKRMRSDIAVQRLGSNPSISIRQMFPGEEDVPLNGNIEFTNVKERTPEGWEKCTSTIQYDSDTKALWQELQKPYGNQSSFLRHLVLLEKYFRNGDLVLSPRASNLSVGYTESVQNRLKAYDNISSAAGSVQPLTMLPFNNPKMSFNAPREACGDKQVDNTLEKIDKLQTSIIPMAMSTPNASVTVNHAQLPKNTPLTLAQANSIASASIVPAPALVALAVPAIAPTARSQSPATMPITATPTPPPQPASVTATVTTVPAPKSKPPGLISLQQASKLPPNTSNKPQSQKIKFPITKNWRPKLIPIDPTAKPEKKPGLVQVISGGKPYHITMEDYKKMCAIKRTYDLRQKRLQETMKSGTSTNPNSLLKSTANKLKNRSPIASDQEENNSMDGSKFERMESKMITGAPALPLGVDNKMPMNLPKIPKSLTVIPQTVTIANKTRSRPSSPNHHAKSAKATS